MDGVVTNYVYDGDQCLVEYDGAGGLLQSYVYGTGIDEPILMENASGTYYYHFDGLGSVAALSDASGSLTESYEYDIFGGVTSSLSGVGNPYYFTGRRYDEETGLYYYRMRHYDPQLGRFLQTDPIGYDGGINLYTYVDNNPVNKIDPLGLYWKETRLTARTTKKLVGTYVHHYWKRLGGITDDLITGVPDFIVYYQSIKVITYRYKYTRVFIQGYVWIDDETGRRCGKKRKQVLVGMQEWYESVTKEVPGRVVPRTTGTPPETNPAEVY